MANQNIYPVEKTTIAINYANSYHGKLLNVTGDETAPNGVYFTKYANDKFETLNKYKVFITKEQAEETMRLPKKIEKKGKYLYYRGEALTVIVKKEGNLHKVITFYPMK
jgi:hypothetical protein